MNVNNFEGSLVLELLAEQGLVDEFYEAIDDDDLLRVILLMRSAEVDEETIIMTVRKIKESSE